MKKSKSIINKHELSILVKVGDGAECLAVIDMSEYVEYHPPKAVQIRLEKSNSGLIYKEVKTTPTMVTKVYAKDISHEQCFSDGLYKMTLNVCGTENYSEPVHFVIKDKAISMVACSLTGANEISDTQFEVVKDIMDNMNILDVVWGKCGDCEKAFPLYERLQKKLFEELKSC